MISEYVHSNAYGRVSPIFTPAPCAVFAGFDDLGPNGAIHVSSAGTTTFFATSLGGNASRFTPAPDAASTTVTPAAYSPAVTFAFNCDPYPPNTATSTNTGTEIANIFSQY